VDECLAVAHHVAHASGRMEAVQAVESLSRLCRVPVNRKRQEARLTDTTRDRLLEQEIGISAWADVPGRLKEKVRHSSLDIFSEFQRKLRSTRARTSFPETGPNTHQPELW